LDQVLRSGTARTVKSRRTAGGGSYTVTCTPVAARNGTEDGSDSEKGDGKDKKGDVRDRGDGRREGGVLVYAADVTDHAEAAERLRTSERRHRETAVTLQRSLLP
ncbi:PAS sensor protein, partial [Streptomyces sp. SID8455]|nr:PAS sensor protein [Streptomyces sp. SID8455]